MGTAFRAWAANAPFDAILVAAAPVGVPGALLEQLALGGRMIIRSVLARITGTAPTNPHNRGIEEQILER